MVSSNHPHPNAPCYYPRTTAPNSHSTDLTMSDDTFSTCKSLLRPINTHHTFTSNPRSQSPPIELPTPISSARLYPPGTRVDPRGLQALESPTEAVASYNLCNDLSLVMEPPKQKMDVGASTPPLTPLTQARKCSISMESEDSPRSDTSVEVFSLNHHRTMDLLEFSFNTIDYTLDKSSLLGSGLWSDVFLATPTLPVPLQTQADVHPAEVLTPPLTPVRTRNVAPFIPSIPQTYAVKVPASRSAKGVIASEARILSHISSFTTYSAHVVPFFGLDSRNDALIMGAMQTTLESFITKELNMLENNSRTARLAEIFPQLALNIVRGLEWLDDHYVLHADIKPANILLTDSGTPIYADFSSSILTIPSDNATPKPASPVSGGTWDFLCPSIVTRNPATWQYPAPSTSTDIYSLAITLLFVIIGHSPFDSAGSNMFRRRDMVKQGAPLAFAFGGDDGAAAEQRCTDLSVALGWDAVAWLQGGLRKVENRVGVKEWRKSLERLVR